VATKIGLQSSPSNQIIFLKKTKYNFKIEIHEKEPIVAQYSKDGFIM